MDKCWMCILAVIFYLDVWINTVLTEGVCGHQCVTDWTCKSVGVMDRCYYVFTDQLRNWYDSRSYCEGQLLSMAKIDNSLLFGKSYLSSLITNVPGTIKNNNAWLGGRALYFNEWSFVDDYQTPVNSDQFDLWPEFNFGERWTDKTQCGCLTPRGTDFSVETQACDNKGYFLCRRKDCYISSQDNCLVLVRDPKTWFEARSHCIDIGGDLFYLYIHETFTAVSRDHQLFSNISSAIYNVHIGMVHGIWKWNSLERSDGMSILHFNWAPGEPNNYEQECLMMYRHNEKWDDNNCDIPLLTLCQGETKKPKSTTPVSITLTPTEPTTIKTNNGSLTPPTAIQTSSTTEVPANKEGNGKALENFIGLDPNTNTMIIIIIGVLLGVFFLLSIALISYILCRKHRAKRAETEDAEIIDNNYYEGTVERTVNDDAPGIITTSNINGNAGDRAIVPEKPKALPSYEDVHLYGNDVTDSLPKNKPVLKPKPKVGPVNGDVYSQVTMVRSTSPISPDSDTTYMNAN